MSLTQDRPIPDFEKGGGLLPVIAQDAATGDVLMLAWMNELAFQETISTGNAVYFSRSRGKLWRKGEESGHVQRVLSIRVDCDADAILLMVDQKGAACHEGYRSCFFRELNQTKQAQNQTRLIAERLLDPDEIYASPGHARPDSEPSK